MVWADLGREFALKDGSFEIVSNGNEKSGCIISCFAKIAGFG